MTRFVLTAKPWLLGVTLALALAFGISSAGLAQIYPGSGDVNDDGQLTVTDGLLIAQHVEGLTTVDTSAADVDGDGNVTKADARLLTREVVGLI